MPSGNKLAGVAEGIGSWRPRNVLLALGMQMLNPTQVSLPFKLLLFVAVDGWGILAQALVTGYSAGG